MQLVRSLLLIGSACSLFANPFQEAEQAFIEEINAMAGIELAGGPFRAAEQHHFDDVSGYTILAPEVEIKSLDQRLSIQLRNVEPGRERKRQSSGSPVAAADYISSVKITPQEQRQIFSQLAASGFATPRDEVTVLDLNTVQLRTVEYLPILKITQQSKPPHAGTETAGDSGMWMCVLLGAQPWQGIPLYRVSFDRMRGEFELESVRENYLRKSRFEIALRPPVTSAQTFFAEPGLKGEDWAKLLRNFFAVDLPAQKIWEGTLSDRTVVLHVDVAKPMLPQFLVKFEKREGAWEVSQAVEFRAEFPRPPVWWNLLPLLSEGVTANGKARPLIENASEEEKEAMRIVERLRGVGSISSLTDKNGAIQVRTRHEPWRGYEVELRRVQSVWRFTSVTEWAN